MTTILEHVLTTVKKKKKKVLFSFPPLLHPEEMWNLKKSAYFQQGQQA